jgi:hypothetical protein
MYYIFVVLIRPQPTCTEVMNIKVNVNDSKTFTPLKLVSQRTPLVDKGTGNVPISLAPAPAFKWSLRRNSLNTMDG